MQDIDKNGKTGKCVNVEAVGTCRCDRFFNDIFYIDASSYPKAILYQKGNDHAEGTNGNTLLLSSQALHDVQEAARAFEDKVADIEQNGIIVSYPHYELTVSIIRRSGSSFDAVMRYYRTPRGKEDRYETIDLYEGCPISEIRHHARFMTEDSHPDLEIPTLENLDEDRFYQAAKAAGDELLQVQLKNYYRLTDREECLWLGEILGGRFLPVLGKEYDQTYTIPSDEIDWKMIHRSDFRILHRPWFAMPGQTHSLIELNPHKKEGVDAGSVNAKTISFTDFLKLYEETGGTC